MSIPKYINCKSKTNTFCDYFIHYECPETCNYAKMILGDDKKKIEYNNGLERFMSKYPNYNRQTLDGEITHWDADEK